MVEFTKVKRVDELRGFGYKNLGIFLKDDKGLNKLIFNATVKNKYDLLIVVLEDKKIYHVFLKDKER